jgi:hypothetical protein
MCCTPALQTMESLEGQSDGYVQLQDAETTTGRLSASEAAPRDPYSTEEGLI